MQKYRIVCVIALVLMLIMSYLTLTTKVNASASVVAVGDNLIHPVVYNDAKVGSNKYDFKPMYKHVKSNIQQADFAYVNQESPIGGDDKPYSGFKQFNTPSDVTKAIVDSGFNIINGANNHSLDQGDSGVTNHINAWKPYRHDVLFSGVFKSQKESEAVHTITRNGITVSLLCYTYGTNGQISQYPYTVKTFDEATIKKDVRKAKEHSDAVIVSAHWGNENHTMPNEKQQKYAQLFADEGVDVVLGMHPHVIQPVKWVKGKNQHRTLVAYSLGNFLNGQYTSTEWNQLLGRLNFNLEKTSKGVTVNNVKWRSMVNHYEQSKPMDKRTRKHFVLYNLHDYTPALAEKHALRQNIQSQWDIPHLQQMTKSIIDDEFLDAQSI
ncbi:MULTISPECIES: CapA family protein [Staphylococcus]|uniref:CapA family protein n=1 Tax=Staphylococcus TaxID=1279 RepID=UPI00045B1EC4|nr:MULTISPECIES: CapA family protein [Staphylococcus]AMG64147.1 CapA family protein [Staphylococcus lugdunensis]ARJ26386.1 capsule biosynthesis protein CapA [Staphylococcus lugdunensis]KAK55462.1 capsule synthesis protein [Staphylococcus lugdunensis VCU150]MCH8673388.1 CapA family protein [Staphylococcus lugdunensis]MCH8676040.1 CapA family protein [Staphylococcus lugdunensis]